MHGLTTSTFALAEVRRPTNQRNPRHHIGSRQDSRGHDDKTLRIWAAMCCLMECAAVGVSISTPINLRTVRAHQYG